MIKRILFLSLAVIFLLSACAKPAAPAVTTTTPSSTENPPFTNAPDFTAGKLENVNLAVMGDASPMPGIDAQNKYTYNATFRHYCFQETEDFFLGSNDYYLRYYDKASGQSNVLCANPACIHEGLTCGGFYDSGAMFYYDSQRWWISRSEESHREQYLYRSDISGINKERVKQIPWEIIETYQPRQYAIHRGNLFVMGKSDLVRGTETYTRYTLLASPLDGTTEFAVLFDQTLPVTSSASVKFVGTKVYYSINFWDQENDEFLLTITTFDLATKKYETVFSQKSNVSTTEPWITETGEIYLTGSIHNPAGFDFTFYLWKVDQGALVEIASWTGEKYNTPQISDGIVISVIWIGEICGLEVRDLTGKVLATSDTLLLEEIPGVPGDSKISGCDILGGDKDWLIMVVSKKDSEYSSNPHARNPFTLLIDLRDGMKVTSLWDSKK